MIGKKIKALLSLKDRKQSDLMPLLDMSSKQSLSNKFSGERFTIQDIIKICDFLDCDIEVKDRATGKTLVEFDKSDL